MEEYNPFDKEVSQLRTTDLDKLIKNEVAEGWFIEYKQDFPSSKKIGHSIAAFANSDGGWYIVGVEADEGNVAKSISGFDFSALRSPKEKIRDTIKTHVSPVPYFESKLIELCRDKAVLVVYVGKGDETPYVTRDGKIYRRVSEGSDPIPETDRYSIQKLFERSYESKERIEKFCRNPFSMSQSQADQRRCFLEAYFYILPFDRFRLKDFYTKHFFDELREAFSTPVPFIAKPLTAHLSFSNFFTSSRSYILRYLPRRNDSIYLVLTLELFENGNAKMFIPMPLLPTQLVPSPLPEVYRDSAQYQKFLNMLSQEESQFLKLIDAYTFFTVFTVLFNQYSRLLSKHNFERRLKVRFRFSESWRTMLYFDDEQYLDFLMKHGLPICLKSEIEIPEFYAGRGITISGDQATAFQLIAIMYEALGFPWAFVPESMYGLGKYIVGLSKSVARPSPPD